MINKKSIRLAIASIKLVANTRDYWQVLTAQSESLNIDCEILRELYLNNVDYNLSKNNKYINVGYKLATTDSAGSINYQNRSVNLFGRSIPMFNY